MNRRTTYRPPANARRITRREHAILALGTASGLCAMTAAVIALLVIR